MSKFKYGQESEKRLIGVDPRLVLVARRGLEISKVDWKVVEGVRSDEQCFINFGKGRSVYECALVGVAAKYAAPKADKVTWLINPLNSKHRKAKDGFGKALDLLPAPYDWKDTKPFDLMAEAMLAAAKELGHDVRWGADWDQDGRPRERGETDSPHFEIAD